MILKFCELEQYTIFQRLISMIDFFSIFQHFGIQIVSKQGHIDY